MVYDRSWRDGYRADRDFDYGNDHGAGRDYTYTSAREYEEAGVLGRGDRGGQGRDRYGRGGGDYGRGGSDYDRQPYGAREYGNDRYARREQYGRGQYGAGRSGQGYGGDRGYQGAYASDGRPFEDVGRYRHADDDNYRGGGQRWSQGRQQGSSGGYGRQPQGYQYEDRGFFERAGDEVRSWFGDDEAERRREMDQRYDERSDNGRGRHDDDYHHWRSGQIAALDRDYDEYRQENRSRFNSEFATWRTGRQGQRDQLTKVKEHAEVVGSDGTHVGTVDKVKGDRILLTKNDKDAGGRHHSIPSSWITSVDDKVTLNKSADEAKRLWQDEDRNSAMFGYGDNAKRDRDDRPGDRGSERGTDLNRSFSGTY